MQPKPRTPPSAMKVESANRPLSSRCIPMLSEESPGRAMAGDALVAVGTVAERLKVKVILQT